MPPGPALAGPGKIGAARPPDGPRAGTRRPRENRGGFSITTYGHVDKGGRWPYNCEVVLAGVEVGSGAGEHESR